MSSLPLSRVSSKRVAHWPGRDRGRESWDCHLRWAQLFNNLTLSPTCLDLELRLLLVIFRWFWKPKSMDSSNCLSNKPQAEKPLSSSQNPPGCNRTDWTRVGLFPRSQVGMWIFKSWRPDYTSIPSPTLHAQLRLGSPRRQKGVCARKARGRGTPNADTCCAHFTLPTWGAWHKQNFRKFQFLPIQWRLEHSNVVIAMAYDILPKS